MGKRRMQTGPPHSYPTVAVATLQQHHRSRRYASTDPFKLAEWGTGPVNLCFISMSSRYLRKALQGTIGSVCIYAGPKAGQRKRKQQSALPPPLKWAARQSALGHLPVHAPGRSTADVPGIPIPDTSQLSGSNPQLLIWSSSFDFLQWFCCP